MAKIGLFYGSNTGKTEMVASLMKDEFDRQAPGLVDLHNIGSSTPEQLAGYPYLICGIPTWNTGQLQDDWEFFIPKMANLNLSGKKVAIFGLGDQNGYGFNFLDAVGILGDALMERGADLHGMWKIGTYQFEDSRAKVEDHFMGLGVDEDGQASMTPERVTAWVSQVRKEFGV